MLFGIGFCTDGGDTHIGLDPINGTIEASDLRLRFEIGGSVERVHSEPLAPEAESVSVQLAGLTMSVKQLFAAFDGEQPRWELAQDGQKLCVDYVVYAGEKKSFNFRQMQQALRGVKRNCAHMARAGKLTATPRTPILTRLSRRTARLLFSLPIWKEFLVYIRWI